MDKKVHLTLYNGCDYLSMLRLKLTHVSNRGPWWQLLSPLSWYTPIFIECSGFVCVYVVIEHMVNSKWFQISTSLTETNWTHASTNLLVHPRNDHPIKNKGIFHQSHWGMCPKGSNIQARYFHQACICDVWVSDTEFIAKLNESLVVVTYCLTHYLIQYGAVITRPIVSNKVSK